MQYCTKEEQLALEQGRALMQYLPPDYIASDTPAEIEIRKVRQTSDTAAIALYRKTTPRRQYSDTIHLRKRGGKWLVHIRRDG